MQGRQGGGQPEPWGTALLQQLVLQHRQRPPPLAPGAFFVGMAGGYPLGEPLAQLVEAGEHGQRAKGLRPPERRCTEATRPMLMKFTSMAKRP